MRKAPTNTISPWAFLEKEFRRRLPQHYEVVHLGSEQAFTKSEDPGVQQANRPILTVRHAKNGRVYRILAINQSKNGYDAGKRVQDLVKEHARNGEHTILLPLDGPYNRLLPIEQSIRYGRGDHEFDKAFSNAGRQGLKDIYEVNGIEFLNRIPITERESVVQRVGGDLGIEHYVASVFTDAEGDDRDDVLVLRRFTMSSEDYQQYPSRKLMGPGILELLVHNDDFSKPGLLVPNDRGKWGAYLKNSIAPAYGKLP